VSAATAAFPTSHEDGEPKRELTRYDRIIHSTLMFAALTVSVHRLISVEIKVRKRTGAAARCHALRGEFLHHVGQRQNAIELALSRSTISFACPQW
jgi:hypothetical protein